VGGALVVDLRDAGEGADVLADLGESLADLGELLFVVALHGGYELDGLSEGFVSRGEPVQAFVNGGFGVCVVRHWEWRLLFFSVDHCCLRHIFSWFRKPTETRFRRWPARPVRYGRQESFE
jgi:hypothetical protein